MPVTVLGCVYPTNAEVLQLQMDLLPRYAEGRLGFQVLPFRNSDYDRIIFQQPDIFRGLQQWRGLGQPTRVVGAYNPYGRHCEVRPGYWGEHDYIPEEFMTTAAQPATCSAVLDLTEHVARLQMRLMERRYNRTEFLIWQALVFGRYEALNEQGQIVQEASYAIQQVSSGIPWSNILTATPLDDFRQIKLRSRGTSASFGVDSMAVMNQVTFNCLARNQNPNDVGKAGLSACCTFMGLDIVNQQFAAQGLPQLKVYDQGFVDEADNFQPYLPDGYVVVVGKRPGVDPIGHYQLTRNAVGCVESSGFWQKLVDTCDREVPRKITLFDGHNGGPAIEYPRAVVVLRTGC